uniref:28S ribosomal protein S24, mitochondrial n=1 Tax=Steinernema glaseri TaxID=37863 RepID=A0A1I7YDB9_9BILA
MNRGRITRIFRKNFWFHRGSRFVTLTPKYLSETVGRTRSIFNNIHFDEFRSSRAQQLGKPVRPTAHGGFSGKSRHSLGEFLVRLRWNFFLLEQTEARKWDDDMLEEKAKQVSKCTSMPAGAASSRNQLCDRVVVCVRRSVAQHVHWAKTAAHGAAREGESLGVSGGHWSPDLKGCAACRDALANPAGLQGLEGGRRQEEEYPSQVGSATLEEI